MFSSLILMLCVCLYFGLFGYNAVVLQSDNKCQMTYMFPTYQNIKDVPSQYASRYRLLLYQEGKGTQISKQSGIPVLFIPGNSGSYQQVRSIAAEAQRAYYGKRLYKGFVDASQMIELFGKETTKHETTNALDFWTIDVNEELSAFSGDIVRKQTEFAVDCINHILHLYNTQFEPRINKATSVILLSHSMGGIVALSCLKHPKYTKNSVNKVVALSTPFFPVMLPDYEMSKIYAELITNNEDVPVLSVAGGNRDMFVPSKLCKYQKGLFLDSLSIANVHLEADHQCMAWCNQIVKAIVRSLFEGNNDSLLEERVDTANCEVVWGSALLFKQSFNTLKPCIVIKTWFISLFVKSMSPSRMYSVNYSDGQTREIVFSKGKEWNEIRFDSSDLHSNVSVVVMFSQNTQNREIEFQGSLLRMIVDGTKHRLISSFVVSLLISVIFLCYFEVSFHIFTLCLVLLFVVLCFSFYLSQTLFLYSFIYVGGFVWSLIFGAISSLLITEIRMKSMLYFSSLLCISLLLFWFAHWSFANLLLLCLIPICNHNRITKFKMLTLSLHGVCLDIIACFSYLRIWAQEGYSTALRDGRNRLSLFVLIIQILCYSGVMRQRISIPKSALFFSLVFVLMENNNNLYHLMYISNAALIILAS